MPIDYARYPPDWLKVIRPRIMARAENRCEVCGLEHNQVVWAAKFQIKDDKSRYVLRSIWFSSKQDAERENTYWQDVKPVRVILTIAHLDHDEDNHAVTDDRLKAMCQICHIRYDAVEKYRRQLSKHN
jgi:ribosomal protein S14